MKFRLTVSNILSITRIVLVIPIAIALIDDSTSARTVAAVLMFVAVATDFLDGWLARALHQVTDLGKIVDPLADKIAAISVLIVLTLVGDVPLWFTAFVVVRDAGIIVGALMIRSKKRIIVQSNYPGKITVVLLAATIIFATLQIETAAAVFVYVTTAMLILSSFIYAKRLWIGPR